MQKAGLSFIRDFDIVSPYDSLLDTGREAERSQLLLKNC